MSIQQREALSGTIRHAQQLLLTGDDAFPVTVVGLGWRDQQMRVVEITVARYYTQYGEGAQLYQELTGEDVLLTRQRPNLVAESITVMLDRPELVNQTRRFTGRGYKIDDLDDGAKEKVSAIVEQHFPHPAPNSFLVSTQPAEQDNP